MRTHLTLILAFLHIFCFSSFSLSAQIKILDEFSTSPMIEYSTPDLPEADLDNTNSLFDALDQAFDLITASSTLKGGFNAAMLVPDGSVWKRATGLAQELPDTVELTTEHLMGMGSIGKSFISATLLLMYEDGLLSLDDTIGMYLDPSLPNIPFNATIRNVLSHRAGIEGFDISYLDFAYPDSIWNLDTLLLNYTAQPIFSVDADWSYSNWGYLVAGKIIEKISDTTWWVEVRKRIVDPLQLDHTFAYPFEEVPDSLFSHVWANYFGIFQENDTSLVSRFSIASSAGCWITTPEDLVMFTNTLYSGNLLQPTTLDEMQIDYTDGGATTYYWGHFNYGLGTISLKDPFFNSLPSDNWGHIGSISFHSLAFYFPGLDITLVVQQNDSRVGPAYIDVLNVFKTLLNTYLTVDVHSIEAPKNVKVFPNPSTGILFIEASENDPLEITVYDAMGQVVLPSHPLVNGQIDLSALPNRLYFLEVHNREQSVVKRIVKQ